MSEPLLLPNLKGILSKIEGNYYLQEETKPVPVCIGCFNVGESCGTPCVDCERKKAWNAEWEWDLMLDEKFIIWKRKVLKEPQK